MTQFDQEMLIFEEIKSKYKPVEGYHLVLDLAAYKNGKEILFKFKLDSEVYRILVNTKYACGNLDCVIITFSNRKIVSLSKEEIDKIAGFIKNPKLPAFLLNRRK